MKSPNGAGQPFSLVRGRRVPRFQRSISRPIKPRAARLRRLPWALLFRPVGARAAGGGRRKAESGKRKAESGKRKAKSGRRKAESGRRKAESGGRRAGESRHAPDSFVSRHFAGRPIPVTGSLTRTGDPCPWRVRTQPASDPCLGAFHDEVSGTHRTSRAAPARVSPACRASSGDRRPASDHGAFFPANANTPRA